MQYIRADKYTIFCDLDGTIWEHADPCEATKPGFQPKLLFGSVDKIREWDYKGYNIILVTGRKESLREVTVKQLAHAGIVYDQLIMGIGGGVRWLINDRKPDGTTTAHAITLERNEGITKVTL